MDKPADFERKAGAAMFALFLVPVIVLYLAVLRSCDGSFTYTLDDPYIHLALARNIWHGNYGINLAEPSAPSSSIVWPFLLAPFASLPDFFEYVPLLVNAACAVASGMILAAIFSGPGKAIAAVFSLVFMLALNFYGLVFTGMEHSLQLLLVLVIVFGLLNPGALEEKRRIKSLFYVSLFLLPLVRYEGLAIALPVLAYRFSKGDRRPAAACSLALFLAMFSFSLYLDSRGLGLLPSSVLAKSSHADSSATLHNLVSNLRKYGFLWIPVFFVSLRKLRSDWAFALMLPAVSALHFLFGKYGWYGRYEIYYLVFVLAIAFRLLLDLRPRAWVLVFVLPLAFQSVVRPTLSTPLAAANIHNQQARMADIAGMLDDKIAVNDLGLVALRTKHYVLDLWGLGSLEALHGRQAPGAGSDWISRLMEAKGVGYAMVYDAWFPERPPNWIKVAKLRLLQERITPASDVVAFYATSEARARKFKDAVVRFSQGNRGGPFALELQ